MASNALSLWQFCSKIRLFKLQHVETPVQWPSSPCSHKPFSILEYGVHVAWQNALISKSAFWSHVQLLQPACHSSLCDLLLHLHPSSSPVLSSFSSPHLGGSPQAAPQLPAIHQIHSFCMDYFIPQDNNRLHTSFPVEQIGAANIYG